MKKLYHLQNLDVAHYSDTPEDRFVWAEGWQEARDILKEILEQEKEDTGIEWDIDDFEVWEVSAENGGLVEKEGE